MSILHLLASAVPVTQPTTAPATPTQQFTAAMIFIVPALVVAALAGVFRRRSIHGPVRLGAEQSIAPILLATLIGGGVWFFAQAVYGGFRAAEYMRANPGKRFEPSQLNDFDYAFLSTGPGTIGLIVLLIANALSRQDLRRRLGYTLDRFPRGVLLGLLGAVIAVPLVFGCAALLELLYQVIRYQHPSEHELLGAMKAAPTFVRIMMVLGACVVAPLFEEVFFRGHLQTLLGRLLARRRVNIHPPPLPMPMPAVQGASTHPIGPVVPILALPTPEALEYARPIEPAIDAPPRRRVWLAVIITSLLFAVIHPAWSAPVIFVLSIGLGYAYERTGNLWVPIVMHALFNIVSTVIFLNFA